MGGISKDEKVNPGDIIYLEKEGELLPIKAFTAMVAVQEHPGALKVGYCPIIFSYCQGCLQNDQDLVEAIEEDRKCQGRDPPELTQFENAEVEFEPTAPLFLEPFAKCAALGRI